MGDPRDHESARIGGMTHQIALALLLWTSLAVAGPRDEPTPAPMCGDSIKGFYVVWEPLKDGTCRTKDAPDPTRDIYQTVIEGRRWWVAPCPPRCW